MTDHDYIRLCGRVDVDATFMGIDSDDAFRNVIRKCDSINDVKRLQRRIESVGDDYRTVCDEIMKAVSLDDSERALLDKAMNEQPYIHDLLVEAACSKVTLNHFDDKVDWNRYESMNYTHLDWPVWVRRLVFKDSSANTPDWYQIIAQSRIHWPRSIRIAMHRAMKYPFYRLAISMMKRGLTVADVKAVGLYVEVNRRIADCDNYLHQLNVLADRIESCQEPMSIYEGSERMRREDIAEPLLNKMKNLLIPMRRGMAVEDFVRDLMQTTKDTSVIKVIENYTEIRTAEIGVLKSLYDELRDAGLYQTSYSNFHKQIKK